MLIHFGVGVLVGAVGILVLWYRKAAARSKASGERSVAW